VRRVIAPLLRANGIFQQFVEKRRQLAMAV
jgi:hypothetical protein